MSKTWSAVTEALIESYALMILVMVTFFMYFCGMVWAFSNPKLSGTEEEDNISVNGRDTGRKERGAVELQEYCVSCEEPRHYRANPPNVMIRQTCDHPAMLNQSPYSWYMNDVYDVD